VTIRDPFGKQALFRPPVTDRDDHLDHDPLVGATRGRGVEDMYEAGPRRAGTIVLECSRCMTRTRMSAVEAGIRILVISAWIPGRHFSRWMLCPECQRRTWCRVHWFG
jgi:hypothetical protein